MQQYIPLAKVTKNISKVNIEQITSEVKKLKIHYQRQFNISRKLVLGPKLFSGGPLSIKPLYPFLNPFLCFSHPETATCKSELLLFPFIKRNFIPHTFCNNKTYILLSLSNQELTFILAFYRLVNICTSEYILKNFFAFL